MSAPQLQPRPAVAVQKRQATVGVEVVLAQVTDLIPAYHLVHLETAEGRGLALTRKTRGIDLAALHVGQHVECIVTLQQPRVVEARIVA